MSLLSSINPFSNENIAARKSFSKKNTLATKHKIITILAVTILALTGIGIVFCAPLFRKLVNHFKIAQIRDPSMTIVITGANRGVGYALTKEALEQGHRVIAACRKPNEPSDLQSLRAEYSNKLEIVELDVQDPQSIQRFQGSLSSLNIAAVDVLVNNAGILLDSGKKITDLSSDIFINTFKTNTLGPILLTQTLLPLLQASQNPRIVNITSNLGSLTENTSGGFPAYRLSKVALNMFTRTLAAEEPEMIVLSLHPGWVQTDMGSRMAPVKPEASAEGLLRVIMKSTLKESGHIYDYTGAELPF
jgi:NAD(P)-dependent dehydrogenase (short-subunit alcohol dehydrogenase family)